MLSTGSDSVKRNQWKKNNSTPNQWKKSSNIDALLWITLDQSVLLGIGDFGSSYTEIFGTVHEAHIRVIKQWCLGSSTRGTNSTYLCNTRFICATLLHLCQTTSFLVAAIFRSVRAWRSYILSFIYIGSSIHVPKWSKDRRISPCQQPRYHPYHYPSQQPCHMAIQSMMFISITNNGPWFSCACLRLFYDGHW